MNNKPNEWEQNIIDNAVEYSIMECRPLDRSTKTIVKTYEEAKKELEETLTAKRMGTVEEFSGVCTFLCSEQAAYISGQNISVDGGNSTNLI